MSGMAGPAMAQGAGSWGGWGGPMSSQQRKQAYSPDAPYKQMQAMYAPNYQTAQGRPIRAEAGRRASLEEVPAVTAPKGTAEFREQVAAEQEAVKRNRESGYSLEDMGFQNKKDYGQSLFAGQQFADEYGDLDSAYQYDFATGKRKRAFSAERIERRKQRGEESPEGLWEDIPQEDLARLKEFRQFKSSGLGQEAQQRFGGRHTTGAYQGFQIQNALQPLVANKHWSYDPRTGGYMAVVGAGDRALLYDKWGQPMNPNGQSMVGTPPPGRPGGGSGPFVPQRGAPMSPGQPVGAGRPAPASPTASINLPQAPAGVAGSGVRSFGMQSPGAAPSATPPQRVGATRGGAIARTPSVDYDSPGMPQGPTGAGGPWGPGGLPVPNPGYGGQPAGGSWQSMFGSMNIPSASHGFDASQFADINRGNYDFYAQRTPQEQRALQGVTDIARLMGGQGQQLYNVGMPAYSSAMNYISSIMGGDKAAAMRAIGPQAGQMAEMLSGAQRGIEASGLRGGARDQALADLQRQGAGQMANLIPTAQQAALGTAVSGGLQGAQMGLGAEQAGAGLNLNVGQLEQANRAQAAGLEQSNRFGAGQLAATQGGLDLQARGMDIQTLMGQREMDLREMLGMAGLNLQAELGRGGLDLQRQQMDMQRRQMEQERKARQGAKWGGLLGNALQFGSAFIPGAGPAISAGIGAARAGAGGGGGSSNIPYYLARPGAPQPWSP